MTTDLSSLIERIEKSEGADRELDALIYATTDEAKNFQRIGMKLTYGKIGDRHHDGWVTVRMSKGQGDPYPEDLPRFTRSIDTAIGLVPSGLHFSAQTDREGAHVSVGKADSDARGTFYTNCHHGDAKSLALALCAAALRARIKEME